MNDFELKCWGEARDTVAHTHAQNKASNSDGIIYILMLETTARSSVNRLVQVQNWINIHILDS